MEAADELEVGQKLLELKEEVTELRTRADLLVKERNYLRQEVTYWRGKAVAYDGLYEQLWQIRLDQRPQPVRETFHVD